MVLREVRDAVLTVGSLFSGIGGFDLGLERTGGFRTVWFCEQDAYCRGVLAKHWPDVPCYYDVRDLGHHDAPAVDVLCGGFPCQDISVAGRGAGIDGERSGLWSEYARLIGELRPRYVVVENVAALLRRGIERVLGDLAALGYDAEWDCLPASAFGAPHQRDRFWLVAYPDGSAERGAVLADADLGCGAGRTEPARGGGPVADADGVRRAKGLRERAGRGERQGPRDAERSSEHLAHADASPRTAEGGSGEPLQGPEAVERSGRRSGVRGAVQDADGGPLQPWRVGGRAAQAGGPEWWAVEPPVGRVAHGVPNRLDQLAALGNALVPQIAEWIGRRILDYESSVTA